MAKFIRWLSSLTPSRQFWSEFRAFRETETGISTESMTKSLSGLVFLWGVHKLKVSAELKGLDSEIDYEWKRNQEIGKQLEELRSQVMKAVNRKEIGDF